MSRIDNFNDIAKSFYDKAKYFETLADPAVLEKIFDSVEALLPDFFEQGGKCANYENDLTFLMPYGQVYTGKDLWELNPECLSCNTKEYHYSEDFSSIFNDIEISWSINLQFPLAEGDLETLRSLGKVHTIVSNSSHSYDTVVCKVS